jgi:hypothetical protein
MLGVAGVEELETAAVEADIAQELAEEGVEDLAEGAADLGAASASSEDD